MRYDVLLIWIVCCTVLVIMDHTGVSIIRLGGDSELRNQVGVIPTSQEPY